MKFCNITTLMQLSSDFLLGFNNITFELDCDTVPTCGKSLQFDQKVTIFKVVKRSTSVDENTFFFMKFSPVHISRNWSFLHQ